MRFLAFVIIILTFLNSNINAAKDEDRTINIRELKIEVPEDHGRIVDSFGAGNEDETIVICIQDAHCHYEAQMNIYHVLDKLDKKIDLRLVTVEGSEGVLDTSPFTTFNDPGLIDQTSQYFMKKGLITGPEYFTIVKKGVSGKPVLLYGIEDRNVYKVNLKAFNDSLSFRERSESICSDLFKTINALKEKVFSEELKHLDNLSRQFSETAIPFSYYCNELANLANKSSVDFKEYNNLVTFFNIEDIGKDIDKEKITQERTAIIEKLQEKLSKEDLAKVVMMSLGHRLKKITATEYYDFLKEMIIKAENIDSSENEIVFKDYPNLLHYIEYVTLFESIDMDGLFHECYLLEEQIARALFQNQDQKDIYRLNKELNIYSKIFLLLLERDDFKYFKQHRQNFQMNKFLSKLEDLSNRYEIPFTIKFTYFQIDDKLPVVETFYRTATKRDTILTERMLQQMDIENARIGVMVTGGFHTSGITQILREKKIPYIIIAPRITEEQDQELYLNVMSERKSPLEELLKRFEE